MTFSTESAAADDVTSEFVGAPGALLPQEECDSTTAQGLESFSGEGRFRARLRTWILWGGKGSLAILDQGLFAGSNFLLNVLLARWLTPAEYGAFALAYSVFLLLGVFHSALLTGPMLVFGPGKYRDDFPKYLGILLRGHFLLMLPGTGLLVMTAILLRRLYSPPVEHAFLGLAVAGPVILLLWLLRRAFYARLDPSWAAFGGILYFLILLVGSFTLHAVGCLTPATGFLVMAGASLIACVLLLSLLRPTFAVDSAAVRAVAVDHWRYGKWVAAAAVPDWFTDSIYFVVLPAWVGLAEAGVLKALLNLAMPAVHTITALGILLMPVLVRDRDRIGLGGIKRTLALSLFLFLLGCTCNLALLWAFRIQIFHVLYADRYAAYTSWPLLLVGLFPFAQALAVVLGAALGALEKSDLAFWATVGSSVVTLAVGIPLASKLGVVGALAGLVASYILMGIFMFFLLMRAMQRDGSIART